ncbi:MAG: hypothetical protein SynsKO_30290 [Synoicihabitans sp.]
MNTITRRNTCRGVLSGFLLFALASGSTLHAQAVAGGETDSEDVVTLSPFTVDAEEDQGYVATSTLAGTRLKTDLADLAGAIQVVTEQFMEDTGVTSSEDLFLYTTNTEASGPDGNFGGGGAERRNPNQARVRGLSNPDRTRGYFLTDIGFDAYNTDRVAIAKGPNALLFGLGSPAGIVNNNLKQAKFQNATRLQVRYGSWGAHREVLDINRVLVEDKLAIRLIGLNNQNKFKQKPAYEDEQRLYGALNFQVTDSTTVRANFEVGTRDATRPNTSSPTSNIPNWVADGMPVTTGNFNQSGFGGFGGNRAPQYIYDGPSATQVSVGFDPAPATSGPDGISRSHYTYVNREEDGGSGFSNGVLTDESRWVFDFRNNSLGGLDDQQKYDFSAGNITLEQRIGQNAGLEISYDTQFYQSWSRDRVGNSINVDTSSFLPYFVSDGNGGTVDPVNPNVRRPYVTLLENMRKAETEREAFRATGYYDLNFIEKSDSLKWLGRHVFTGVYSQQSSEVLRYSNNYGSSIIGEMENVLQTNRSRDFTSSSWDRRGQGKRYLGPAITGIPSDGFAASRVLTNVTPRVTDWSAWMYDRNATPIVAGHNGAYREVSGSFNLDPITSASIDRQEIDTFALTGQSFFFNENIVGTYGWRRDEAKSYRDGSPDQNADNIALVDSLQLPTTADNSVEANVFSWGLVGHVPDSWTDKLGLNFSVHYAESENFVPSPGRISILNRPHPSPAGSTEEYGFSIGDKNDKFHVRFNWYETISTNQTDNSLGSANIPNWERLFYNNVRNSLQELELRDPNDPSQGYWPNNINWADTYTLPPLGMREAFWTPVNPDPSPGGTPQVSDHPNSNVTGVSDFTSTGMEIEGVWNPTRNWTLAFNAAQQEVVKTNVLQSYREYFDIREPQWIAMGDLIARPNTYKNANPQTIFQRTRTVQWARLIPQISAEGAASHEIREWRTNFITNYKFDQDTKLKGWSVGGAYRWQSEQSVGFLDGTTTGSAYGVAGLDTIAITDVTMPVFGVPETNVDLWFAYTRKILNDKVNWKIQLNVRNVLDNDDLIITQVDGDGLPTRVRILNPMNFRLTSTWDF